MESDKTCIAFEGTEKIASGELYQVALATREAVQRARKPVLIFDALTSQPVEIDFRGTEEDLRSRLAPLSGSQGQPSAPRGPGRPRLGVVAREVTLLPRHWEWLNRQPGGASVALRKLVEEARKSKAPHDRRREAQESAYRFMSAMAGNERGFEEASRALFGASPERFSLMTESWPRDVRDHARALASRAFDGE